MDGVVGDGGIVSSNRIDGGYSSSVLDSSNGIGEMGDSSMDMDE